MQFRMIPALIVFLGSYLPLSIILLAQNFQYSELSKNACVPYVSANCTVPIDSPVATIGFALACSICMVFTLIVLAIVKPKKDISIRSFEYIPTDLMNYTLPYVVSFMNVDFADAGNFVGFGVFLSWMFWITYRSGQILLNPVLIAFGWRHYSIEFTYAGSDAQQTGNCLTKSELQIGGAKKVSVQSISLVSQ